MNSASVSAIRIEPVSPEVIRPLRAAILRPGRSESESIYPLDDAPSSVHLAALDERGSVIGSASFYLESSDKTASVESDSRSIWSDPDAWRLRGMTVVEPCRGCGIGSGLLRAGITHIQQAAGACLWCHARVSSQPFYERHKFMVDGEAHEMPPIGPHVFMWRPIGKP